MVIPIIIALPPLTSLSLIIYAIKLTDQLELERTQSLVTEDPAKSISWIDSEKTEKV